MNGLRRLARHHLEDIAGANIFLGAFDDVEIVGAAHVGLDAARAGWGGGRCGRLRRGALEIGIVSRMRSLARA